MFLFGFISLLLKLREIFFLLPLARCLSSCGLGKPSRDPSIRNFWASSPEIAFLKNMSSILLLVRLPSLQSKSLTLFFAEYIAAHIAAWSAKTKPSHLEGDILTKTIYGNYGTLEQAILTPVSKNHAHAQRRSIPPVIKFLKIRTPRPLRLKSITSW